MTPVIAMPGCFPPDSGRALADAGALPELPALSALLHGARRLPGETDWRGGVLAVLGMVEAGSQSATSPARVAACAAEVGMGMDVCLVQPVHMAAGISRVFLADAGGAGLAVDEREALRLAFNAEFGSANVCLHAVGQGWLLQAPFAAAADAGDPVLSQGAALAREPARTAAARALRLLGAEVEMWLASLPFNSARQSQGVPRNAFWFWGGTSMHELPPAMLSPHVICSNALPDAWLAGLAAHCQTPVQLVHNWREVRDTANALIVLQSQGVATAQHLAQWHSNWIEPALQDLKARRLRSLRLQIGGDAWQWPAPLMSQWLRRRKPWWQMVSA
jgi:hypothetical protein